MPLTVKQIENTKAGEKDTFLNDGGGLYLFVTTTGSKRWRFRYYFQQKRNMLSLGLFPTVGLKEARDKAANYRKLLEDGIDPSVKRVEDKAASANTETTFEHFARKWLATKNWSAGHAKRNEQRLARNIFPALGHKNIASITEEELREVLRAVEKRGVLETQKRICDLCSHIFKYARKHLKGIANPAELIKEELPSPIKKNYPTITHPTEVGKLLRALEANTLRTTIEVSCAIRIAPYVLLRPGNICEGEWAEINFSTCEWTISAEKMKMRRQHIVPLSTQAMEILQYLYKFTGRNRYLFPSHIAKRGHITTDALRHAIHRSGYAVGEFTTHGFRHMGTTLLNELGFRREWIELQLAHEESNAVVRVYNHALYMQARRGMMQEWGNYLDELKMDTPLI